MTGAGLAVGVALLTGVAAPAAQASTPHHGSTLRPRLSVCFCGDAVAAQFRVDRYDAGRHAWVAAADVPVTVEARIPGNSSAAGWRPQELLPRRSWSGVRTDDDGAGSVRLEPQLTTMEYRLLLANGTHTTVVRPYCPEVEGR
jgi:hypothetical protein